MKSELRAICQREINRINKISEKQPLEKDDIEKLKSLATALKTLEDSKTPESDSIAEVMRASSVEDIFAILDATEDL